MFEFLMKAFGTIVLFIFVYFAADFAIHLFKWPAGFDLGPITIGFAFVAAVFGVYRAHA